jgi:hypothetical protein
MRPVKREVLKNRPGAVMPIVAICLVMLVGCAAIAIDIGLLFDSRAEAQRAADSAALAGASAIFHYRDLSQAARRDTAILRAVDFAGRNRVRGQAVEPAEVTVTFPQNRIAATVTREAIAPFFAGIFGVETLRVSATAHAVWFQGGTGDCLKPFGVPERAPFTLDSVGRRILIWEKDEHNLYPLVKHLVKSEGGNNVRDAIESETCNAELVTVGERLELQSGTAGFTGQVEQGLRTLMNRDPGLMYDPTNTAWADNDGFSRPDWRSSPRVINLVTYDMATTTQTTFVVTGFLTIFLDSDMERDQGNRLQYGTVLPHRPPGGSGPCTPPDCSALTWGLRLVQ